MDLLPVPRSAVFRIASAILDLPLLSLTQYYPFCVSIRRIWLHMFYTLNKRLIFTLYGLKDQIESGIQVTNATFS